MRKLWLALLCRFGVHDWKYHTPYFVGERPCFPKTCRHCAVEYEEVDS